MVASGFQKIFRLTSLRKFINYSNFDAILTDQIPKISKPIDQNSLSNQPKTGDLEGNPFTSSHLYPSFSFEYFINPVSPAGSIRSELVDVTNVDDDHRIIRADSVKKKRKKKMNKHKLRKLRKRLRRKT